MAVCILAPTGLPTPVEDGFWARGYCVDTVGLDETQGRAYVQYQEKLERAAEQRGFDY